MTLAYLVTLPFRMALAALLVPVHDVDEALGLSESHRELIPFIEAHNARWEVGE